MAGDLGDCTQQYTVYYAHIVVDIDIGAQITGVALEGIVFKWRTGAVVLGSGDD